MIKWICDGCGAIYVGWAPKYNPCPKCGSSTMEPLGHYVFGRRLRKSEAKTDD